MPQKVVNPYDVGQIIAPIKKDQPKLWQALDTLNRGVSYLNDLATTLKALSLYERVDITLPLEGTTDIARYVVQMPIDSGNVAITSQLNITRAIITSKNPSSGDEIDILISTDRGTTFNSILKDTSDPDITYDKLTLPSGLTYISYGRSQFSKAALYDNNFLRFDILSGDVSDGIQISLVGNYSLVQ